MMYLIEIEKSMGKLLDAIVKDRNLLIGEHENYSRN